MPHPSWVRRAIGSVVERFVHTEEVTGSNPVSPTGTHAPFRSREGACVVSGAPWFRRTADFRGTIEGMSRSLPGRAARLAEILDRDGATCVWCGRAFAGLVPPTTEHVVPRVKGGPSWLENEVAACRRCNSERGHRNPVEWLEECLRRGWDADERRLHDSLLRLAEAIARGGGPRRGPPVSRRPVAAAVAAGGPSGGLTSQRAIGGARRRSGRADLGVPGAVPRGPAGVRRGSRPRWTGG